MRNFRKTVSVGFCFVGLAGVLQSIHDPFGGYFLTFAVSISITIFCFVWAFIEFFYCKNGDLESAPVWKIGEAEEVHFDKHKYKGDRPYLSADKVKNITASNIDLNSKGGDDNG